MRRTMGRGSGVEGCDGDCRLGEDVGGGFLDRSKVRILLCDNDVESSEEVFGLLCKCSYQVTSVKTARQVIDALNAEGPDIDIILTEVDLPVSKGFKMLKYIMRNEELRRIPIIMMSAKDEVPVVVKCLRLGAADYLVKPLRTNELLNLWTHMWRRRRMLGLVEKDILSHDFDLVASDPSDANTNSTNLFSDDTDDRSRRNMHQEQNVSNHREHEPFASANVEPAPNHSTEYHSNVQNPSAWTGGIVSFPKKSELKVGESSAFFTYVRSGTQTYNFPRYGITDENVAASGSLTNGVALPMLSRQTSDAERNNRETWESYPRENGSVGNAKVPDINMSPVPSEFSQGWSASQNQPSKTPVQSNCEPRFPGVSQLVPLPFYFPGMMNQNMMPSSGQMYPTNLHGMHMQPTAAVPPQYNTLPHCPSLPTMTPPLPYYPVGVNMQPCHAPAPPLWPSSSSPEMKSSWVERREAALIKFRRKRKDRCFDKKIRYINRKRLAESRPRVRGQFVRQVNGVDVDLNGRPSGNGDSDEYEEDEDDEERLFREHGLSSSTDHDA
ncbi:Two-component response regulator-like APRR1 [Acorus gramineus]|uniref:Pseudo-response regulator 1 n=1 Tax=Acorus gramineus TaxID=55184 RepID=A0AAV9A8I5_ACOGR|nr:Two-component response regulator-like APRR1 [Acorus gramineus]